MHDNIVFYNRFTYHLFDSFDNFYYDTIIEFIQIYLSLHYVRVTYVQCVWHSFKKNQTFLFEYDIRIFHIDGM